MSEYDVVVVGGGVAGLAAARALATDHAVLVCERGQLAGGATALAAGEVTMTPSYTDEPAVADHAMEFFHSYDGTGDFSFTECPSVELVVPEREGEARRRAERLANQGVPVDFLEPETVVNRYPRLDMDEFAGGVEHRDTGFIDPYTFAVTLADDAERRGATIRTNTPVEGLHVEDETVRGVKLGDETVAATHVVVAAGWRTPEFLGNHVRLPVRPYRTQCLVLEPDPPLDDGLPMGWIPGEHVYFRPEHNGDLLVGGWSFAENDPEAASDQADEAFRDHVARLLPRFVADANQARLVDGWAGCDAATPDTRPIVDAPPDAPDGLVVATGFHGRGVMTAPVTATLVRSLLVDESPPFPVGPFRLDRFDDRSTSFEFRSISAGDD